jgi:hypothetical protein
VVGWVKIQMYRTRNGLASSPPVVDTLHVLAREWFSCACLVRRWNEDTTLSPTREKRPQHIIVPGGKERQKRRRPKSVWVILCDTQSNWFNLCENQSNAFHLHYLLFLSAPQTYLQEFEKAASVAKHIVSGSRTKRSFG